MKYHSICTLFLFCGYICLGCHNNKDEIIKIEVRGIITDIYQDKKNHEVYTFNIKANSWYDGTFISDFYPKSWLYASLGDSIIKNKGESFITIKKRNGSSMIFETRLK